MYDSENTSKQKDVEQSYPRVGGQNFDETYGGTEAVRSRTVPVNCRRPAHTDLTDASGLPGSKSQFYSYTLCFIYPAFTYFVNLCNCHDLE